MYQTIGEPIAVIGLYKDSHFIPHRLKWGTRELKIDQITLISDVKDGGIKKRFYSVVIGKEVLRILFNRDSEQWTIEEIWVE